MTEDEPRRALDIVVAAAVNAATDEGHAGAAEIVAAYKRHEELAAALAVHASGLRGPAPTPEVECAEALAALAAVEGTLRRETPELILAPQSYSAALIQVACLGRVAADLLTDRDDAHEYLAEIRRALIAGAEQRGGDAA